MLVRGARECRSGVVPPGVTLCAFAPKQTMHNIQIRQTMRNTCHMQANASFFLCKDTGKFRECFSKPPFFYPERSFCLFAPGFFRRFACLPAPRFCANIMADRFPATDGQGGAQTTGEQEVPYQRQVRLYLFSCRPSGQCRDYF